MRYKIEASIHILEQYRTELLFTTY